MAKNLVIVESPAKARTIGRFLGKDYLVEASMGHVRDLAKKVGPNDAVTGVELTAEGAFIPRYEVTRGKGTIVAKIKKEAKAAENVYLATDQDREGEAIAWHLLEAASIDINKVKRVVFHEITEPAIEEAFANPRVLDTDLVNAQQARRVLDRLVGFSLSPTLWRKVRRNLSAGRVQSVAVRMIVDKEKIISDFIKEEFWIIDSVLKNSEDTLFKSSLLTVNGEKSSISNEKEAKDILEKLEDSVFTVSKCETKESKKRPSAPFITSTLQQEASRKLRFSSTRTMNVAQRLYEGKSVDGRDEVGLITYMRTDSTNVSSLALSEIKIFINDKYGPDYLPSTPRTYSKKVQGAQEAHEAIRPTSITRTPESLKNTLDPDELRLYRIIWRRMLSSQMVDALYDRTVIDIKATSSKSNDFYGFRTTGNVLKFEGFQAVYSENKDEDSIEDEDNIEDEGKDKNLPKLTDGQELLCTKLQEEQKFTQPPARFSEASLINSLEKEGVGRPSTYASTISTIQDREYVLLEKGRLHPTLLGKAVTGFLTEHFENVLNVEFTSLMEKKLDLIAEGSLKWNPMVLEFYEPFNKVVESVLQDAPRVDYRLLEEKTDMVCEKCESPMVIKTGRNGRFVACSGFPDCKNAISLTLSILGIDVRCPKCNQGELAEKKKTKGNKRFYGCLNYPDCDFAINSIPFSQPCPECSWLLIASGTSSVRCSSKECGYRGSQKDLDRLQKELT